MNININNNCYLILRNVCCIFLYNNCLNNNCVVGGCMFSLLGCGGSILLDEMIKDDEKDD